MEAVLLIEDSRDRSREARLVPAGRSVLVGRAPQADLRLSHPSIAPLHVRLTFDGRNLWAEDLETQTGSWLGQRLLTPGRPEAMREGEPLQLGEHRLSLTTSPTERQCALPLSGPQGSEAASFDERWQLTARAAEALHQRDLAFPGNGAAFSPPAPHPGLAAPAAHPALAAPVRPPVLGTMVVANAVPNAPLSPPGAPVVAQAAAAPRPPAPVSLDAPPPLEASSPSAPPVVFPEHLVSARQTMALEPTVLAALESAKQAAAPRSSGHTAIIAAARPEPGAGSLTFSGFSLEGRESLAPQALAAAARGRPVEQGARGSSSRDRSTGNAASGRASSSSSARRSSGASGSARASAPRRRVVRQRASVWPFLLLGAVVLGLGGVAANLFLHGELPWAHKRLPVVGTSEQEAAEAPAAEAARNPGAASPETSAKPPAHATSEAPAPRGAAQTRETFKKVESKRTEHKASEGKTKPPKAAHGRERPHHGSSHPASPRSPGAV